MKIDVRVNQVGFWRRQVYQIIEGGLSVLFRKCLFSLLIASVIPIIFLVRALRPLVLVRFQALTSHAIGPFAGATELYLCERDAGLQPKRTIDIFYHSDRISNQQLKKMWKRALHIFPVGRLLNGANSLLPGGAPHVVPSLSDQDYQGVIPRSRTHLWFTVAEERLGQAGLRDLGLPEGATFICVNGRDTGFKRSLNLNQSDGLHDYRNTSIHHFVPAAEELVQRGYFVIRMGAFVNEALQTTNPMIIDYATTARSDFMDIYLSAKCLFFLGCSGGLIEVPRIFRRPVVHSNTVPLCTLQMLVFSPICLLIPKKLWRREERRVMTFPEFLETWPESFSGTSHFERIGVDVIENTPEELLAVAVEMDERLKGTWQTTEEDKELQQRFWSLLEITEPNEEFRPRMGAEFLRQNRELLG